MKAETRMALDIHKVIAEKLEVRNIQLIDEISTAIVEDEIYLRKRKVYDVLEIYKKTTAELDSAEKRLKDYEGYFTVYYDEELAKKRLVFEEKEKIGKLAEKVNKIAEALEDALKQNNYEKLDDFLTEEKK